MISYVMLIFYFSWLADTLEWIAKKMKSWRQKTNTSWTPKRPTEDFHLLFNKEENIP